MKNQKPIEFDKFEPASDIKWVRCPECGKSVNVFDTPVHEPLTFGGATKTPEVQTHWCLITCRCRKTRIKAYGKIVRMVMYGCFAVEKTRPSQPEAKEGANG